MLDIIHIIKDKIYQYCFQRHTSSSFSVNTINVASGNDAQLQLTVMRFARVGGQKQRLGSREGPLLRRLWRPDPNLARVSQENPPQPISVPLWSLLDAHWPSGRPLKEITWVLLLHSSLSAAGAGKLTPTHRHHSCQSEAIDATCGR